MNRLMVIGNFALVRVKNAASRSQTVLGGAGYNIALSATANGCEVGGIAAVGSDLEERWARRIKEFLPNFKITVIPGKTCRFYYFSSGSDDEPIIDSRYGVASAGISAVIKHINKNAVKAQSIHVCCRNPINAAEVLEHCSVRNNNTVSLDFVLPSVQQQFQAVRPWLRTVTFIFVNKREYACVARSVSLPGLSTFFIVTKGSSGADIYSRGKKIMSTPAVPAPRVVDTSAAGDAFAGGFLAEWAKSKCLLTSLKAGTFSGMHAVTAYGMRRFEQNLQRRIANDPK